jgi:ectoine hydroxylase-related dioxygenase (phytanoyl-CoA dioxygenase family)
MVLTTSQVDHFRQEGYVVVPAFFGPDEVAAMQAELERLWQSGAGRNTMPAGSGKVNYHLSPLGELSPLFRALPFKEEVVAAVEQLIGSPILLWLDQIFLKPAGSGMGNSWHTDNACFMVAEPTLGTGMWVAIHDASRANGTLELIPRSHQLFRRPDGTTVLDVMEMITIRPDESQAVAAEMAAGGVVFFNYAMLHCTRDNHSGGDRAAAAYHFLNAANVPADKSARERGRAIWLSGPEATGGEKEYGLCVADTWWRQVQAAFSPAVLR